MGNVLYRRPSKFTQVSNQVLQDKRLSWKARGIYAFLVSKASVEGWKFNRAWLINQSEKDQKTSYDSGVEELKTLGYLTIERIKNAKGQFDYRWFVEDQPLPENPEAENQHKDDSPLPGFPIPGKGSLNNNTEISNTEKTLSSSHEEDTQQSENPDTTSKRKYTNPHCSTRWYLEEFCPLFEQHSGRVPLTRGKEFKQAESFFKALASLNPHSPPEDIYRQATEGVGLFFLALAGQLDEFSWIRECPADIGWFTSNAAAIDRALKKRGAMTDEEIERDRRAEESLAELGEIERCFDEGSADTGQGKAINGSGISIGGPVS